MTARTLINLILILCTAWGWTASQAQKPPVIGELSNVDKQFMQQQRMQINDLTTLHLGGRITGARDRDIGLLQRLLDEGLVRADQRRELQAMGIVLGDLLAAELDLHWVIYEDEVGRSRALRYKDSDNYSFPITMISRRQEADNQGRVTDIYQKAYVTINKNRPALPFSEPTTAASP